MSTAKFLPSNSVKFFAKFDKYLPRKMPQFGERFLVVQPTEYGDSYGRFGKIIDIRQSPNTGMPIYVFDYETDIYGPDNKFESPHAWARAINCVNGKYELWTSSEGRCLM
jgi:hypothetical protein